MPYFVYKVFTNRTFEPVGAFPKYREAKQLTRKLRAEIPEGDEGYTYRMIFAGSNAEAERLLSQKREPRPMGEDV
jgi:hypothetical protein